MIYVVIDISKLNHFASVISSDSEILIEPFKFTNDYDGFQLLVSNDCKVYVINPIQTSTMHRNNICKTNTDKVDTFIIAKTLMMNPHRLFTAYELDLMHLKNLGRLRHIKPLLLCI